MERISGSNEIMKNKVNMRKIRRDEYNSRLYRINRQIIIKNSAKMPKLREKQRISPIDEVDHIISIEEWQLRNGDMEGCSDLTNLQGLCYNCHNEKTDRERKRYWKRNKPKFAKNGRLIRCLNA